MHVKKMKGDLGVAKAIARITELGWNCCVPITEHASYDLIAEKNGECLRVQVKYCTANKGVVAVKLANSWADKNGNHTTNRQQGQFDLLAIYNPDENSVYFLRDAEFANCNSIALRLKASKNGQKTGIRMASNYLGL